jgi:hypothetical protein
MRSRFRARGVRHLGVLAPEAPCSENVALRAKYEEIRHADCMKGRVSKGGHISRGLLRTGGGIDIPYISVAILYGPKAGPKGGRHIVR